MKLIRATPDRGTPEEWVRPGGVYRRFAKELFGEGMPFDAERVVLAPGETNWPYHSHVGMWEVYFVQAGRGSVRCPDGPVEVAAGDWFIHPPGEPHNLTNTGTEDLVIVVLSDTVDKAKSKTTIHDG